MITFWYDNSWLLVKKEKMTLQYLFIMYHSNINTESWSLSTKGSSGGQRNLQTELTSNLHCGQGTCQSGWNWAPSGAIYWEPQCKNLLKLELPLLLLFWCYSIPSAPSIDKAWHCTTWHRRNVSPLSRHQSGGKRMDLELRLKKVIHTILTVLYLKLRINIQFCCGD